MPATSQLQRRSTRFDFRRGRPHRALSPDLSYRLQVITAPAWNEIIMAKFPLESAHVNTKVSD